MVELGDCDSAGEMCSNGRVSGGLWEHREEPGR